MQEGDVSYSQSWIGINWGAVGSRGPVSNFQIAGAGAQKFKEPGPMQEDDFLKCPRPSRFCFRKKSGDWHIFEYGQLYWLIFGTFVNLFHYSVWSHFEEDTLSFHLSPFESMWDKYSGYQCSSNLEYFFFTQYFPKSYSFF